MSILEYVMIQSVILICYASWVAYRVGFTKGQQHMEKITNEN